MALQTKAALSALIDQYIKANAAGEITGPILNTILTNMVDSCYGTGVILSSVSIAASSLYIQATGGGNVYIQDLAYPSVDGNEGYAIVTDGSATLAMRPVGARGATTASVAVGGSGYVEVCQLPHIVTPTGGLYKEHVYIVGSDGASYVSSAELNATTSYVGSKTMHDSTVLQTYPTTIAYRVAKNGSNQMVVEASSNTSRNMTFKVENEYVYL